MLEEDFSSACPSGVFVFGLLETIPQWIDGDLSYGLYTGSRAAARNMENQVFRLEAGKYQGVAFATLGEADFTPDLIMIFCNSKDTRRLALASTWATGEPLRVDIFARDLCSEGVVQPLQTGHPAIAIPCGGDRRFGGTDDDEIVFTTPLDRVEVIMEGLENFREVHKVHSLGEDSKFQKSYKEMAKILDGKFGRC